MKFLFFLLLTVFMTGCISNEQRVYSLTEKGNKLYENKEYTKALEAYNEGLKLDGNNSILLKNKAATLYKLGKFQEAIEILKSQDSYLLLGNCYKRLGDISDDKQIYYKQALDAYKAGIIKDQKDKNIKLNYEIVNKLIEKNKDNKDKEDNKSNENNDKKEENESNKDRNEDKKDNEKNSSQDNTNEKENKNKSKNENNNKDMKEKEETKENKEDRKDKNLSENEKKEEQKKTETGSNKERENGKDENIKENSESQKTEAKNVEGILEVLKALENKEREDLKNNININKGNKNKNLELKDW